MPTVLNEDGFRFFFYSSEGNEPAHIHIEKGDAVGKIWLEPTLERAYLHGFTKQEEKKLFSIVEKSMDDFKRSWHEYFNK